MLDLRESALNDGACRRTCEPALVCLDTLHLTHTHTFMQTCKTEFEAAEDPMDKSFFSEIVSSVSDCKYSADGQYILSRDYLTLKVCKRGLTRDREACTSTLCFFTTCMCMQQIWDVKMENKPVMTIPVYDYLKPHLAELYESDCIFDKVIRLF